MAFGHGAGTIQFTTPFLSLTSPVCKLHDGTICLNFLVSFHFWILCLFDDLFLKTFSWPFFSQYPTLGPVCISRSLSENKVLRKDGVHDWFTHSPVDITVWFRFWRVMGQRWTIGIQKRIILLHGRGTVCQDSR